MTFAS